MLPPQLTLSSANSPFAKVLPESRLHMPSVSRRDGDRHNLESSQEEERGPGPFQHLWREGGEGRLMVENWKGLGHVGASLHPLTLCPCSHNEGLWLLGSDQDSCYPVLTYEHSPSVPPHFPGL